MRKGLVVVVAVGVAISSVAAFPAAAELVPGGWGDPIPMPPERPPTPEPAVQRPVPPIVRAPVRRPVHRRPVPESSPSPDGKVQF